jgi:hypothetical protein
MRKVGALEVPWSILIKANEVVSDIEESSGPAPVTFDLWQNATVKWLCTPEFFATFRYPELKVAPMAYRKHRKST